MQQPEEDVRAFVGPNADYYLQAWAAVDPNVGLQALRWNWPAFFLNVFWLLVSADVQVLLDHLCGIPGDWSAGGHGRGHL